LLFLGLNGFAVLGAFYTTAVLVMKDITV